MPPDDCGPKSRPAARRDFALLGKNPDQRFTRWTLWIALGRLHRGRMSDAQKPDRPPSDESLLARFRRGHNDAATALYLRYAKRLHSLVPRWHRRACAPRLDAEDVVQSVFRTFFRRASAGHYSVPAGDELWKLFLVIALHKTRDASARHRAASATCARRPLVSGENDVAVGHDEQALSVLQLTIDELLGRLPKSQRQIVELRIQGLEVAEIAEKAGRCPPIRRAISSRVPRSIADADGGGMKWPAPIGAGRWINAGPPSKAGRRRHDNVNRTVNCAAAFDGARNRRMYCPPPITVPDAELIPSFGSVSSTSTLVRRQFSTSACRTRRSTIPPRPATSPLAVR